jgi:transketolase
VKGRGVSFMEGPAALQSSPLYLFHSGAPPEPQYAAGLEELLVAANARFAELGLGAVATEARIRTPRREPRQTDNLVGAYEKALVALGERRPDALVLDADLIKDCGLLSFAHRFPDRFVECGIAEQDMVSMAGGMARRGALPLVHSFACFLAARPNEQIYNQGSESSRSSTWPRSPACCPVDLDTRTSRCATSRPWLRSRPGHGRARAEAEVAPSSTSLVDWPGSGYLALVRR